MSTLINSMSNNDLLKNYLRLNTATKTNSEASNASNHAKVSKLQSEINGLERGNKNTYDMDGLVKTADSALGTMNEGLQRVRELGVQARNDVLTIFDLDLLQLDAAEILKTLQKYSEETQFNNIKLLDGSFSNKNTTSSASSVSRPISIQNMSLEALGLSDFSVSSDSSLDAIDQAISTVNAQRSNLGAVSNAFAHTIVSNDITAINMATPRSSTADTDFVHEVPDTIKSQVYEQYQNAMIDI